MRRVLMWLLVVLGVARMAADVVGLGSVAAVLGATGAAPAPKVFSAVRGLETYSTEFFVEWTDVAGEQRSLALTPDVYARLRGPYNRRNVYGAVLAYGPVLVSSELARPMYESVARFALSGDAPILRELGVEPDSVRGPVRVRLVPRANPEGLPLVIEVPR